MRKLALTAVLLAVWCSIAVAEDLNMGSFTGLWEVNYARTMQEGKKSPKYDEEHMPAMIKSMMSKMKIKLTDTDMIYLRGAKEIKLPFSVTASDADSVTVAVKQGDREVSVMFTLIEQTCMNFKSSGSDDMDYYVWQRVAEGAE